MTQIQKVKDIDAPEVFGLPSDVEKNIMRYRTLELVNQLKIIQSSSEKLKDKVEVANVLFTFWQSMLKKIDKPSAFDDVSEKPLENWVMIEITKAYRLIKLVNETLKGLKMHANGTALIEST